MFSFYQRWLVTAFRHSLGVTDAILFIFPAAGAGIAWALGYEVLVHIPWWAIALGCFATVFLVRLVQAPYWLWDEEHSARAELEPRKHKQAAVDALAEERTKATDDLFNRLVQSDEELAQWETDFGVWCQSVGDQIEQNFSRAMRLNFDSIGSMIGVKYNHAYNQRHNHLLMQLGVKLDRLKEIIAQHSE